TRCVHSARTAWVSAKQSRVETHVIFGVHTLGALLGARAWTELPQTAEERTIERGELAIQVAIRFVFGGRWPGGQELLYLRSQARFVFGVRGRTPAFEQRPFGNDESRFIGASSRFGVKVPDSFVAEPVPMRIARENIAGNILGQVPG